MGGRFWHFSWSRYWVLHRYEEERRERGREDVRERTGGKEREGGEKGRRERDES